MSSIKPLLILIPGFMCDARLFSHQITSFSQSTRVKVADITKHSSIFNMAKQIIAEVEETDFYVVGLSMGGIVAMEMLAQAQSRIKKLALLNTNFLAEPMEKRQLRNRQIEQVLAGELESVLTNDMMPYYLLTHGKDVDHILNLVMDMALKLGADVFCKQSLALASRPDYREILSNYKGQTLVLSGAQDQLCSVERHTQIANLLYNSRQVVIPNCGHLSTLEKPKAVTDHLLEWIFCDV